MLWYVLIVFDVSVVTDSINGNSNSKPDFKNKQ